MKKKARRLDGTRAEEHGTAALPPIDTALAIDNRRDAAAPVALHLMDEAGRADLGTGHHGPGQVGHVHAGLGAVAATLVTRAASDASLPDRGIGWRDVVRHDGGGCVTGSDPELSAGGAHRVGRSVAGHRRQRIAPTRIPRVG